MPDLDRMKVQLKVKKLSGQHGVARSALMPILHDMQNEYGWLPPLVLQEVATALDIHKAEVEGVASFYSFFRTQEAAGKNVVSICQTISCDLSGKAEIVEAFEEALGIAIGETSENGEWTLEYANCMGLCDQGPGVLVNEKLYAKVTTTMVPEIIEASGVGAVDVPFNIHKKDAILEASIDKGEAIQKALSMSRPDLIAEIRASGIRGRGGAGFPTAMKWQLAGAAQSNEKYIVCNADEGEPGTFKDRLLLVERAHELLEGMTIGAYAIGARYGLIYLRAEYYYMKDQLEEVIAERVAANLLGKDICGKDGFNFELQIRMGAGAYICGEETALIESMEGKRGEPRNRPPFPVDTGFMGKPTSVNNVETFISVAFITVKGGEWFNALGTEQSKGTKILSISGHCDKPGIYEYQYGITVKEMLAECGGSDAKAVQVGGASGLCIPAKDFDRSIAFEDIPTGGSIMVFGQKTDMRQVAINFMEFFAEESCGQCTPCREGNEVILEGLDQMVDGDCEEEYLEELLKLSNSMTVASKCGLGQTSSSAFANIAEHFRGELLRYEEGK
ncbi:MAG: NAD(P)H-dependent oxidoreductase subunit E [Fibrobacterales bacterium]